MQRILNILILFAAVVMVSFGSIPQSAAWEVRPSVGSDTNGGGFDTTQAGTDFSQQNAKNSVGNNISTTDLTTTTTGAFTATSLTASFTSAITGNLIYLSGGTGGTVTTGWYEATFATSTTITLDRSPGAAATNVTMNIGGALSTITQLNANMQAGNIGWIKSTAIILLGSKFVFNMPGPSAGQFTTVIGYGTTRGDSGQVTIQANVVDLNGMIQLNSNGLTLANVIIDCHSQSNSGGLMLGGNNGTRAINVLVENCTGNGGNGDGIVFAGNPSYCFSCTVTGITAADGAFIFTGGASFCFACVAYGNNVPGFTNSNPAGAGIILDRCISANNTGASSHGFIVSQNQGNASILNSVAYGNGGDGFRLTSSNYGNLSLLNNISFGNSGFGINLSSGAAFPTAWMLSDFNGYGSNTSGNLNNVPAGNDDIVLSASPFVNGGSNDFELSAGGITAVGGKGFPGALAVGGTGHLDLGALQHAGGSSSAGTVGFPIVQF